MEAVVPLPPSSWSELAALAGRLLEAVVFVAESKSSELGLKSDINNTYSGLITPKVMLIVRFDELNFQVNTDDIFTNLYNLTYSLI